MTWFNIAVAFRMTWLAVSEGESPLMCHVNSLVAGVIMTAIEVKTEAGGSDFRGISSTPTTHHGHYKTPLIGYPHSTL